MLVNAAQMLKDAEAGHYALGAFNTNNLEWTLAILQAAEEAKSPLIIQCSAGAAKWMGGFKVCADMVKAAVEATGVTVPVALHLDHGTYENCLECIEAGFTSVMYDGSHEETFQINLDRTAEIVKIAHEKGISVEAEVGGIGGVEDGIVGQGEIATPISASRSPLSVSTSSPAASATSTACTPRIGPVCPSTLLLPSRRPWATCRWFSTAALASRWTRFRRPSPSAFPRST